MRRAGGRNRLGSQEEPRVSSAATTECHQPGLFNSLSVTSARYRIHTLHLEPLAMACRLA